MIDQRPHPGREGVKAGARGYCWHVGSRGSTYFVTTLIFTPKTPVCFLDGVLFRLISRLVNFMENSTWICLGVRQAQVPQHECLSYAPRTQGPFPRGCCYHPGSLEHLQGGSGKGVDRGERRGTGLRGEGKTAP